MRRRAFRSSSSSGAGGRASPAAARSTVASGTRCLSQAERIKELASASKYEIGSDGLPDSRPEGAWSRDKLHFVAYFSDSVQRRDEEPMADAGLRRSLLQGLVDASIAMRMLSFGRLPTNGSLKRFNAQLRSPHLFFNDINPQFVKALKKRQKLECCRRRTLQYFNSDCNKRSTPDRGSDTPLRSDSSVHRPVELRVGVRRTSLIAGIKRKATDLIVTFHTTVDQEERSPVKSRLSTPSSATRTGENRYWKASRGNVSRPPTTAVVLIDTFRDRLGSELGYTKFG